MVSFQTRFEQIGERRGEQRGEQRGMQRGIQIGEQRGKEIGLQLGEATMLLQLLERKFGAVSDEQRQRILAADADMLLAWLDCALTAADVDEVLH